MARFRHVITASFLLLIVTTTHAQVLDQIIPPSTTLTTWEVLGNASYDTRKIVVGDFNGDNLDDLFWDEQGSSSYRIGMLQSNGDGTFSPTYSTKGSPYMKPDTNFTNLAGGRYVTGKFYGGNQSLLLQFSNGQYQLYSFLNNDIYPHSGKAHAIGKALLESAGAPTKFVTGRFVPGLKLDVLLSFEFLSTGREMARLQRLGPFDDNFNELWSNAATPEYFGGWYFNWGADEFVAADFVPGNDTDELLCINRTNGWLKIMRFDGQQWVDLYANYGTYEVYPTPTTGATTFSTSTSVFAGNFDTSDANAEVLLFEPSRQLAVHAFEFDPATSTFRPETKPLMDLTGLEHRTKSSTALRVYERWRTPRYCAKRFLGICFKYTGGNQIQQERDFYTETVQDGDLQVVAGNFYNNGWSLPWSRELLVFRNAVAHIPDLPPYTVFYTSCPSAHMYSGLCGSKVDIYNVLGQVINRFDPSTGWFDKRIAFSEVSAVFSASPGSNF